MFWVPLAMAAGGAMLGKAKADRQQAIEDQTRKMRAAEQQYSWASGHGPQTQIQHAGSAFGEMAGGALGGLGTGLSMGGMFSGGETTNPVATADARGSAYEEMLRRQQSPYGQDTRTMFA
jgi:hypothetical protein